MRTSPYIRSAALMIVVAGVTARAEDNAPPNWTGTWKGSLVNLPARPGARAVEVTREIGAFPAADNTCTAFKTSYAEAGVVKQVKDYRLCRGLGPDDLFVDEGGGVKLTARVIGDALISPFKYDTTLLISTMRLRGDVLEEEILTVEDKPATQGPLPLRPRGIQRMEFRRVR